MSSLRLVPYGPPATYALRDAVTQAKNGDPLAPVTVAIPSNYAGLSLRRRLGAGDLSLAVLPGKDREGLVNVRFLVLARIAELLGAARLAGQGRRPLTAPVRAEAVRAALAAQPGVFQGVEGHASTERSLEETFRELRQAPPSALDAAARQSPRAAHVVALFHAARQQTAAYYDEEDLALAAAQAVREGASALADIGQVVLFLPRRLSPGERSLVEALAEAGRLSALLGLTADPAADALARRMAAELERTLGQAGDQAPVSAPSGTQVVAVADAEEEVRTAIRLVMERLAGGTPLHRMAVLYPAAQPYSLLAHEQFEAAAVPHNGPAVRTLAQTLTGRTLLGLLRLRERDFRRDLVMDWLSAAPILEAPNGAPAPAHRWDALSRSAGVIAGAAEWQERLARYRRSLEAQREALLATEEESAWRLRRLEADAEHAERLARFIEELVARADPGGRSSWAEFASWARGLLDRHLGGEGHRRDWPVAEIEAHRAVEEALAALSNLGDVRPRTDEATFRRALERALEAPAGRVGRFGEGVFIGRIADALGTDFDVVFLLGMAEGLMPPRARDDPLLPDHERSAAGDGLPQRTGRLAEERRDYLAALAAAPERVLLFSRADLRGQRGRLPGPWLLETASQLEGSTLFSTSLDYPFARSWFTEVPSFEAALRREGEPASEQEYDLRSLLCWRRDGTSVTGHYLVQQTAALSAGIAADLARLSASLSRWDGRLPPGTAPAPSAERPVSPTALQDWASCPFRYFLGHVLSVAETERPEELLTLSPLERGNLLHRALERFLREHPRTAPDQPWSAGERARLIETGERLCDDAEAAGVTGKRLLWRLERARILRDLAGFLDHDEALRAEQGVAPVAMELAFGVPGADQPAAVVSLPDGRSLAFRGRIDRVDRAPDRSRLLVLDYKTGAAGWYRQLDKDPVLRGRALQLPVYALAAQQRFAGDAVAARYWFVNEQANYGFATYDGSDDSQARFWSALAVIAEGIERGLFPARPGQPRNDGFENCLLCPYDRICPRDRGRTWQRKREAPELRGYLDLAEPEG